MRFLLPLMFCTALAACSSNEPPSRSLSTKEAQSLLIDRNWMDRMPETDRDKLYVYRFVPSMGGGVFQDRTLFKGTFELFMFESTGNEIRFVLPETKEKVTSKFTIENVDGPKPFDLKLTITDDPRGPKVYYGMRSETDRDGRLLDARLRAKIITN
jgi:hypothetical protein